MSINFNVSDLPSNGEEAFAMYEERVRKAYEEELTDDRQYNSDRDGNYYGNYEPERSYVTKILAFLDEYSITGDIEDISDLENEEFYKNFGRFKSRVQYISTRFDLRQGRVNSGNIGTQISLQTSYKPSVGEHLEKIRKIINQEVDEGPKKDKIFKRISALQSEIDRDRTTIDAAFGRMIDLAQALGAAGEEIKPAVDQLERIKKIFFNNSEKIESLPKPERPKMIPKADEQSKNNGLDDEIPF